MGQASLKQNRLQHSVWVVLGGASLFAALVFWAITDRDSVINVKKEAESEAEQVIQPEKVAATSSLGALQDVVKPLDLTARVMAVTLHEPEFRGTKFIQDNKRKSTLELFRSTNEDIVKIFLRKQSDRSNLYYIRLSGEDLEDQFVVLYGLVDQAQLAEQLVHEMKVKMPATVKPVVRSVGGYQSFVNDLGSDEMKTSQKTYAVKLRSVALPRVDETQLQAKRPETTMVEKSKNLTTTVTRRNTEGNVVDVQKQESHSAEQPSKPKVVEQTAPSNAPQTIHDPFN